GETAEHPGLLAQDEYDVAGAVTGVVEAGQILGPNGYVTAMSLLPWSLPGRIPTAIRSYVQLWPHSIGSGMTTLQNSDGHWAKSCRSEEHTSELQSRFDLVCRLLLEKKKNYRISYI